MLVIGLYTKQTTRKHVGFCREEHSPSTLEHHMLQDISASSLLDPRVLESTGKWRH